MTQPQGHSHLLGKEAEEVAYSGTERMALEIESWKELSNKTNLKYRSSHIEIIVQACIRN